MAANPYHTVRNETATPLDLWDRGYRRCVSLLQRSKLLMESETPEARIEKAQLLHDVFAIVQFWSAALPSDGSPADEQQVKATSSLASRLRPAYDFILHRIVSANANNSPKDVSESLIMLQHLYSVLHKKPGS
ncbi:flagellar protein FliS [Acidithiobacillus thiooxidans]|uniref:Uncharacterized protein n=1 Tax=Acidithiobacillus thiooxidans TaxID=930 RepID=A0A1C2I864_ACITH|nr:flagellar protein FliS [Acidithiobacillus thiooxidans]OCX72174.1 hypothetical protein A6M23_10285 [Acidithiobacillus thiooxidans]OCX79225.1 hypothetical protein A6P08_18230 [Acidithiobacillus thiooxidans]